jgi:hypothetical protein
MRKTRTATVGLIIAAAALLAGTQDLGKLRALLLNRTGEAHKAVGIVAGLVDATGERFVASGVTAPGATVAPDADTVGYGPGSSDAGSGQTISTSSRRDGWGNRIFQECSK